MRLGGLIAPGLRALVRILLGIILRLLLRLPTLRWRGELAAAHVVHRLLVAVVRAVSALSSAVAHFFRDRSRRENANEPAPCFFRSVCTRSLP